MSSLSLSSSLLLLLLSVGSAEEVEDEEDRKDDVLLLNEITISIKMLTEMRTETVDVDVKINSLFINVNLL